MFSLFLGCNSEVNVENVLEAEKKTKSGPSTPTVVKTEWLRTTNSDAKSQLKSIHYDNDLNIYVVGFFQGTLSFDPNISSDTFTSTGTYSINITKFNKKGSYQWTKVLGDAGTSYARPKEIRVDSTGDIIILGDFSGTMDTDPGVGVQTITSNGSQDIFLVKLNTTGEYVSSFNIGNTGYDESESFEIDASDNIFYVGTLQKKAAATDFDPTGGTDSLAGFGGFDVFVTKINSDGTYGWTYYIGGTGSEWGGGIDIDDTGNIYFGSKFNGTIDADPSGSTVNLVSNGSSDVFVIKMSNSGSYIDSMAFGGSDAEYNYDINVDSFGNILVAGSYKSSDMDFDPGVGTSLSTSNGDNDIYFAKYDSSFNLLWGKGIGSSESDRAHAIDLADDGSIYIGGYFSGSLDANTGAEVANLSPHTNGSADTIILKYDTDGNYINSFSFKGDGTNQVFELKVVKNRVCTVGSFMSSSFKIGVYTDQNKILNGSENSFILYFDE